MKWLHKIWPWKEIDRLNGELVRLRGELAKQRQEHDHTKAENHAIKAELITHQKRAAEREGHVRKMAQIIAIKGGIIG